MMNETIMQSSKAMTEVLKKLVEKYELPAEEVYKLAGEVFHENMQFKKEE